MKRILSALVVLMLVFSKEDTALWPARSTTASPMQGNASAQRQRCVVKHRRRLSSLCSRRACGGSYEGCKRSYHGGKDTKKNDTV